MESWGTNPFPKEPPAGTAIRLDSCSNRRQIRLPDHPRPFLTPTSCPSCGNPASGKFCSHCGALLGPATCARCQATLSPEARFCHRCGAPVGAAAATGPAPASRLDRVPWLIAGISIAILLGVIGYTAGRNSHPAAPDMANNGAPGGASGPSGQPPDISQMSPRERFDRLFDRVMSAAEQGDTGTVARFSPMALGAYEQLDSFDADARYHAAMIHLALGQTPEALALADTLLQQDPGHLFGYVIRTQAAQQQNRPAEVKKNQAAFLQHYDAEMKKNRVEYQQHRPVVEDFKKQAQAASP
jgi:double zinc ribbon protein